MHWKRHSVAILVVLFPPVSTPLVAQSPATLYTWEGTGNDLGWIKNFGENDVEIENRVPGELTIAEVGRPGAGVAISDGFNTVSEDRLEVEARGIDLTGLLAVEFELGHDGPGPVVVEFFVQATPEGEYVALGENQIVEPGVGRYALPVTALTPGQIAHIRTIGFSVQPHPDVGNVVWTLRQVRTIGRTLLRRDIVDYDRVLGLPATNLLGAWVRGDNEGVEGNDGGQNQTGLRLNTSRRPPGNTASLQWVQPAGTEGARIAWGNGTRWTGDPRDQGPTDLSNYRAVSVDMAATPLDKPVDPFLEVRYFVEVGKPGNFEFIGDIQRLPVDGEFHTLSWESETPISDSRFVISYGVDYTIRPQSTIIIDISKIKDWITYIIPPCNCYFSSNCADANAFCDYGPAGPYTRDICAFREPKPDGLGPGCDQGIPGGGYGQCDGRCATPNSGSACWVVAPDLVAEAVRLWGRAILEPLSSGGGLIEPELVEEAARLVAVAPCAELLGRSVGGNVIETMVGDVYEHPDVGHDFQDHSLIGLVREDCILEALQLGVEALALELENPGPGMKLLDSLPERCPEILETARRCPDLDPLECIQSRIGSVATLFTTEPVPRAIVSGVDFRRGFVNTDRVTDLTDAIVILEHQFLGRPRELGCAKAADIDDSGLLDLTDPILLLEYNFLGGPAPRPPFQACGADPSANDGLACREFPLCE